MKRLWNRLAHPTRWILALFYPLTAVFIAASILFVIFEPNALWLAALSYLSYVLAAFGLGYSIYTIVLFAPSVKARVLAKINKSPLLSHIVEDYGFRTVIFATATLVINVAYAIFNGVVALLSWSFWYAALTTYYLFLIAMRGMILFYQRQKARRLAAGVDTKCEASREIERYRFCGVLLIVLPISLSFSILQMVALGKGYSYPGLVIYVVAAYTFFKVVKAILNIIKAGKSNNMSVQALRNIGLADAMVSILALQTAMFASFGANFDAGLFNALTGGAVCVLTVVLGILMLVLATRAEKQIDEENTNGR